MIYFGFLKYIKITLTKPKIHIPINDWVFEIKSITTTKTTNYYEKKNSFFIKNDKIINKKPKTYLKSDILNQYTLLISSIMFYLVFSII